jgi:hypothetical protein
MMTMRTIQMRYGDTGGDGHNITRTGYIVTDLTDEVIARLYKGVCELVGFDFLLAFPKYDQYQLNNRDESAILSFLRGDEVIREDLTPEERRKVGRYEWFTLDESFAQIMREAMRREGVKGTFNHDGGPTKLYQILGSKYDAIGYGLLSP